MFETLPIILPFAFQLVGAGFAVVFIVILLIILLKGIGTISVRDLFQSSGDGGTSLTKFWQNVAYMAATISFLAINIAGSVSGASIEMIWVIYLGIVASSAVLSKWIAVKYNRTEEREGPDGEYRTFYPPQRYRRGASHDTPSETPSRVDNPDAE